MKKGMVRINGSSTLSYIKVYMPLLHVGDVSFNCYIFMLTTIDCCRHAELKYVRITDGLDQRLGGLGSVGVCCSITF